VVRSKQNSVEFRGLAELVPRQIRPLRVETGQYLSEVLS
jgi:hypothetical protein